MSLVFDLPDALIKLILSEWLELDDFLYFDMSICNKALRQQFLRFLADWPNYEGNSFALPLSEVEMFPASPDSYNYGEKNVFKGPLEYCLKRKVRIPALSLSEWPFFDMEPESWNLFLTGVNNLTICDGPATATRCKAFRRFQNLEDLNLICRNQDSLYLPECSTIIQNQWPKLRKLSIYAEDQLKLVLTGVSSQMVSFPECNSSLKQMMSKLTKLDTTNIFLSPSHIYTLFGDISMPLLEELSLCPGTEGRRVWTTADYRSIKLKNERAHEDNRVSETHLSLMSSTIEDNHDVSFAVALEDSDIQNRSHVANRENFRTRNRNRVSESSDDEDEDDDFHAERDFKMRIAELHRPRRKVTSEILCWDDFCAYFAQEKAHSMPHLKSISGLCTWIYPLLPTADSSKLRFVSIDCINEEDTPVLAADSLFHTRFPSLHNVTEVNIHVYKMEGEPKSWDFCGLLSNMPNLTKIVYNCHGSSSTFGRHGIVPAMLQLTSPIPSLESLAVTGDWAKSTEESGALVRHVAVIAPNLKSLECVTSIPRKNNPCFYFDWLSSGFSNLEVLRVENTSAGYDRKDDPNWDYKKDFVAVSKLHNLKNLTLMKVPVWIRDDVLEQVIPHLTKLEEFILSPCGAVIDNLEYDESESEDDIDETESGGNDPMFDSDNTYSDYSTVSEDSDEDETAEAEVVTMDISHIDDTNESVHHMSLVHENAAHDFLADASPKKTQFPQLPPIDEEAFEATIKDRFKGILFGYSKVLRGNVLYVRNDDDNVLKAELPYLLDQAYQLSLGLDANYITTKTLDLCAMHMKSVKRLEIHIPCLDLSPIDAVKYRGILPPNSNFRKRLVSYCKKGYRDETLLEGIGSGCYLRVGSSKQFPKLIDNDMIIQWQQEFYRLCKGDAAGTNDNGKDDNDWLHSIFTFEA